MKKSEETRLSILLKAYELIYLNGYQATSIDDILASTKVTKGAFYYHFKNKEEMGLAILQEILCPRFMNQMFQTFHLEVNTREAIYIMIANLLSDNEFMKFNQGCPLSNLIQEMSPKHAGFSDILAKLTQEWQHLIVLNIELGKKTGFIKVDAQAHAIALFVISSYWGVRNFGRLEKQNDIYRTYLQELRRYLNTLS